MAGTDALVQAGEARSARIEALRAVAALGVLTFHVVILTKARGASDLVRHLSFGGAFGVFLFFALTGYLLFTPFARSLLGGGPQVDLRGYTRNRALRILPLYWFVLVVLLVFREHGGSFDQWWRFATFTESFFRGTVNTVDGPMWSLAVEVQFYVLLPLLAIVFVALARGSALRVAGFVLALGAASAAIWWVTVYQPANPDPRWRYSLPVTFFEFTPGMLLALARVELERNPRRWGVPSDVLLAAGLALWAIAAYNPRPSSLIVAPASFLVLAAVVLPGRDLLIARVLDLRALGALGVVSYSLYLWQFPAVDWLEHRVDAGFWGLLPLAVALCIPLSAATYLLVERPFLRLRRRWGATLASQPRPGGGSAARSNPAAAAAPSRPPNAHAR